MGHFCDGRASLVVGTHTHVPTADHRILSGGTAFITDVGMTGDYDSVIGMAKDEPLQRFLRRIPSRQVRAGNRACDVVRGRGRDRRCDRACDAHRAGAARRPARGGAARRSGNSFFLGARPITRAEIIHADCHAEAPMAGHSQFKNIMHRKGRQDAIRSKLFGKLAREITVAAKIGLPDPAMNPRLRAAILAARAENMPKDNIDARDQEGDRRRRREL